MNRMRVEDKSLPQAELATFARERTRRSVLTRMPREATWT